MRTMTVIGGEPAEEGLGDRQRLDHVLAHAVGIK